MKKFLLVAFIVAFVAMTSLAFAADKEKKNDWTLSATTSFWSEYVTTSGAVLSGNPSFQPELTLQHKSGVYVNVWGSIDMIRDDFTEADYILGYRKKIPLDLTVDFSLAYYQYQAFGDQISPRVQVERAFLFHGVLTPFIKQEFPIEVSSGRFSSCSYPGFRHDYPITNKLTLSQTHQLVIGNSYEREWSSEYAFDLMLPYKFSSKLSFGPGIKVRVPMSLPSDDCRKPEAAIGGFVTYNF